MNNHGEDPLCHIKFLRESSSCPNSQQVQTDTILMNSLMSAGDLAKT